MSRKWLRGKGAAPWMAVRVCVCVCGWDAGCWCNSSKETYGYTAKSPATESAIYTPKRSTTYCNTLQHTATHCNILQHPKDAPIHTRITHEMRAQCHKSQLCVFAWVYVCMRDSKETYLYTQKSPATEPYILSKAYIHKHINTTR